VNPPIVTFIVPALNEEANLAPLFDRLLGVARTLDLPIEILIVDDASEDRTFEVAQEAAKSHPEIRVIHKPLPHGLGRGVRAGLAEARGRVGVVVMADGVDPLETTVPAFCKKILEDGCHLVLLSRYMERGDSETIPMSYKVLHVVFRFLTSTFLGIPHPDTTYAFRAFDIEYMKRLKLRSTGFEISPEITFRTFFSGGRIGEIAGRQTQRFHGQSKFRFAGVARGYIRVVVEGFLTRVGLIRPPYTLREETEQGATENARGRDPRKPHKSE